MYRPYQQVIGFQALLDTQNRVQSLSVIQFDCLEDSEGILRPWQEFIALPETNELEEEQTDKSVNEPEFQIEPVADENDNET